MHILASTAATITLVVGGLVFKIVPNVFGLDLEHGIGGTIVALSAVLSFSGAWVYIKHAATPSLEWIALAIMFFASLALAGWTHSSFPRVEDDLWVIRTVVLIAIIGGFFFGALSWLRLAFPIPISRVRVSSAEILRAVRRRRP